MSDDISNLLGNNVKKNANINIKKNNTGNFFGNFGDNILGDDYKNKVQNTIDYTKNTISDTKDSFNQLGNTTKILLLFGILLILFIIGLIIKYYRDQKLKEKFANQPLFMTGIEDNKPHNAKKIYRYTDPNTGKTTSYIPGNNFNENNGIEYTFSFWMFIDGKNWDYRFGEWKHIFHRGTAPLIPRNESESQGENMQITKLTNQLPGFWISPKENRLNCVITTTSGEERITLEDIPINKWMNIVVTINNNNVALYQDGMLHRTITLIDNINSSKDAVYVNYFGGFAGNMAYLQFFNKTLTPMEIMELYQEFKVKIDMYIKHMFNNEINRMKLSPFIKLEKEKCNYLDYIKQERDKTSVKDKITGTYNTLCKNTKGNTVTKCKNESNMLGEFLQGIPGPKLKDMLDNLVNSVKPMDENKYQYSTLNGKKNVVYLTKDEYQKIKNVV